MGVVMFNWPWKSRKARIEEGWDKVRTAVEAGKAEHQAVLDLAEKRSESVGSKREAYAQVLEELLNRKRGLNEHLPPLA